jgi:hypothetical protein
MTNFTDYDDESGWSAIREPADREDQPMSLGPNDGGIKRGDREDTGDNEAAPTEGAGRGGSGVRAEDGGPSGVSTADPSSMGGDVPIDYSGDDEVAEAVNETGSTDSGGIDDLTIMNEDDPNLGLTDIGEIGPDDWAADTGPTATPEAEGNAATNRLNDRSSTLKNR